MKFIDAARMSRPSLNKTTFIRLGVGNSVIGLVIAGLLTLLIQHPSIAGIPLGRLLSFGPDPNQVIYFYPGDGAGPHKLLAIVHGGGWRTGAPDGEREAIPIFMAKGYSVANIGYRLYPQIDGRGEIRDVAQGLAHILSMSDELALDRHNVTLLGHSAGGHIVALLGTDRQYLEGAHIDPNDVHAIIAVDGVYDLPSWSREKIKAGETDWVTPIFGPAAEDMEQMSPLVKADSMRLHPRFCLISQASEFRFGDQADAFEAVLKARKEKVDHLVVEGVDHMQLFYTFELQAQPMQAFAFRCLGVPGF
jgi:arylformamidase